MSGLNSIVFYSLSDNDPLSYLRVLSPMRELGIDVIKGVSDGKTDIEKVLDCDLVIIQRDFPSNFDDYKSIISLAHRRGKPVVFDIDDLLFELPADHPDRISHHFAGSLLPTFQAVLEADLVTVSTQKLREYISKYTESVVVLPNYLDERLWQLKPPSSEKSEDTKLIIGYMGGHSHEYDFYEIEPVLHELIKENSNSIEIHFWGLQPPKSLARFPQVKWRQAANWNYPRFAKYFQKQKVDIFIAPLVDNYFNQCKSPIKYLEYSALGVPGIYSRVKPYSSIIHQGVNGLLASSQDEWLDCFNQLLENPELRFNLSENAQKTIKNNWLLSNNSKKWLDAYERVQNLNIEQDKGKRNILRILNSVNQQIIPYQQLQTQEIKSLKNIVKKRDDLVAEQKLKLKGISSKDPELIQREQGIILREQDLGRWEQDINLHEQDLVQREQKLEKDKQGIGLREKDVKHRENTLLQREQEFISRDKNLVTQINDLEYQLAMDKIYIRDLFVALDKINNSFGYRVLNGFRYVIDRILPYGSWRRRIYESLHVILRTKVYRFIRSIFKRETKEAKAELKKSEHQEVGNIQITEPSKGPTPLSTIYEDAYGDQLKLTYNVTDKQYVEYKESHIDSQKLPIKLIAFYLPQFHPIPENDKWWGKGFTEWTNVSKAVPQFLGHYQPHLPGELGYYDLRVPEIQIRQVELAKNYGVYGFCFYYYWFGGKRLLERPLNQFIENSRIDFPFCVCWANENWSRRWDGSENDILIGQKHSSDDYLAFIRDLKFALRNKRYIRVDNKPMLLVYRVDLLPDSGKAVEIWRSECRKTGIGDIFLVAVQSFGISDPRPYGFDAAVEFPPHHIGEAEIGINSVQLLNPEFRGRIFDYQKASQFMLGKKPIDYMLFKTVMPSWDNTPRRNRDAHIFINSDPEVYKNWLSKVITYTKASLPDDKQFAFINAWNEWGECNYIEPDRKYGYSFLNATVDCLFEKIDKVKKDVPNGISILFVSHDANPGGAQSILLNIIKWFKEHTTIKIKALCLGGGDWLSRFEELCDTRVMINNQLTDKQNDFEETAIRQLLEFCGDVPNLVYGNSVASGSAYLLLSKLGVPILTHVHEMEMSINRYAKEWIGDIQQYTTHYIAVSDAVKNNLIARHHIDSERITVIHGGIIPDQFERIENDHEKRQVRERLGLVQDKLLVFGIGIGMPFRKGADLFIETALRLSGKYAGDMHFYWIGGFDPNEVDEKHGVWKDYEEKIAELPYYITFLGYKDNARQYLGAADVFLLTSREDPFPLVVLEAAEAGVPIICFNEAGGAPEFVKTDAGIVVPNEDTLQMSKAIIKLWQEKSLRKSLGETARIKLKSDFTIDRLMPRILSTCQKVTKTKPAVSIIVPNYNHEKYIKKRLDSIINQTYRDYEVIILDDASTDNSLKVIDEYAGWANVRVVKNEKNSGSPFKQWLKGLEIASADIIWIAESDDHCEPTFLEELLKAFNDSKVKLAYANSWIINELGETIGDYQQTEYLRSLSTDKWNKSYQISGVDEINDGLGIKNTILNISSVLFRKPVLSKEMIKILSSMKIAGDWYLIANIIKDGDVYYESKKLNYHRRHSASVIGNLINQNKVELFFNEYENVQKMIISEYSINSEFINKWEDYLRQQWNEFFPSRPFNEIPFFLAYKEIKEMIKNKTRQS